MSDFLRCIAVLIGPCLALVMWLALRPCRSCRGLGLVRTGGAASPGMVEVTCCEKCGGK